MALRSKKSVILVFVLIPLRLCGAVFVRFVTVDIRPPRYGQPPSEPSEEDLNLTVVISDQGFHFKVNPNYRLPWMVMATADTGPDIPKKDNDWDFAELNRRLRELKDNHSQEISLILAAEDDIPYEVLINAMDYSRGTSIEPLFPDFTLTRCVV